MLLAYGRVRLMQDTGSLSAEDLVTRVLVLKEVESIVVVWGKRPARDWGII